jgi:hypothetical protein
MRLGSVARRGRVGFVAAAAPRRTISVTAGERVTLVFTLHRGEQPGPGEPGW